jgi:molecular chaperone DnaK
VTPSVIYIDRRGNKYVGKRAYDSAPQSPDNAAMLFKRLMGTSTPIHLSAVNRTMTPEECSAEILKVLFGYLPEEIRNNPETGTVITVPAAFNQMQKDATMQAANMAGIGMVALMQEPVAAVMSVMRTSNTNGMFLIFDMGGGTLDIAIAESLGSKGVNLLAHGGIAMCGGRDFDRVLVDNVVRPWLLETFNLPKDFSINPNFKRFIRLTTWAAEQAKIELSSKDESKISLSEDEAGVRDLDGNEIYLDIPLQRNTYDKLISDRVGESIEAALETLKKAGLSSHDLERVVFVGGPTNYKPLRDKVSFELGVPGNIDVDAMTAVAEGASIFAESIDWSSKSRSRKSTRGRISSSDALKLSFNYNARTPDAKAKIAIQITEGETASGCEFQIDSIDTGWTSGRLPLEHGAMIDVALTKQGDNTFKVFVFDSVGGPIALEQDKFVITRTVAAVNAIPASHSIGIEVQSKLGGRHELEYLIRSGDPLPKKGKKVFKAGEILKAGTPNTLNFNIWEGEIEDPIDDNRFVGWMKISGTDFDDGVIHEGADLECEYEILDSGNINIMISVPSIGASFSPKNFYSRQEGQRDYSADTGIVIEESEKTLDRVDKICKSVNDPKLEQVRRKLEFATSLNEDENETEKVQESWEKIIEARRLLAQIRKEHLKEIRQMELDGVKSYFDDVVREYARPTEETAFDNLIKTAQRSIDKNDSEFESYIDEMRRRNFDILWREDWFVIEYFKYLIRSPRMYTDRSRFDELAKEGTQLMRTDEIEDLRGIVDQLYRIKIKTGSINDTIGNVNIIRGN